MEGTSQHAGDPLPQPGQPGSNRCGTRIPTEPHHGLRDPRTLRGLTLLHSGAGIEERVMEEFVCRTTDRRGLGES